MKKLFVTILSIMTLGINSLNASGTAPAIDLIVPYAVYDLDYATGQAFAGEYLHSGQITSHDYNDKVQSQIAVRGYPTADNPSPQVKIGNSIGNYIGSQTISDANGIVIGFVMGYKHLTVTQGILQATYNNVYDASAYIR